jgi:ATP-dependent protease ClpP protease subunit
MAKTVRIDINGYIGETWWDDKQNTVATLIEAIGEAEPGDTLEVHVNSGGGSFFEGLAIYNNLRQYAAKGYIIETYVDGLAASAASLIMLAGDRRVVPESAMIMIHNVSMPAWGDAKAMEKAAATLHQFNKVASDTYRERTNETADSVLALMDEETWMGGAEALDRGFATEIGKSDESQNRAAAMACVLPENLKKVPAWLKAGAENKRGKAPATFTVEMAFGLRSVTSPQNSEAPPPNEAPTNEAATPTRKDKTMEVKEVTSGAETGAVVEAAVKAEAARQSSVRKAIENAVTQNLITAEIEAKLKAQFLDEGKGSVLEAKAAISDAIIENAKTQPDQQLAYPRPIEKLADARDKFVEGVTNAALSKIGASKFDPANEFNHISLRSLATTCLERAGIRTGSLSASLVAERILNMNTSSDFPLVLENIQTKAMLKGYEEAPEKFDLITRVGSLPDYKTARRISTSMFPSLAQVREGAEYEEGAVGERNASIFLSKYGRIINITEEMIVNDDQDAFGRLARQMGSAARRTIGNLVWAIITDNPNFNGSALFAAGRQNLFTGVGSALADAGLTAAYNAFLTRTDAQTAGGALTDAIASVPPKFLITSIAQEQQALRLMAMEKVPATGGGAGEVPNTHRGRFEVISDARLDRVAGGATRWFLAADPNMADTIEVAYLDGQQTPTVTRHEDWKRDSFAYKVKIIAGVAPLDYVGLQRNDGV